MTTLTADIWRMAKASAGQVEVPSFSTRGKTYTVRDAFTPFYSCTCDDHRFRGRQRPCKHVAFVRAAVSEMIDLARSLRDRIEEDNVLGTAAAPAALGIAS